VLVPRTDPRYLLGVLAYLLTGPSALVALTCASRVSGDASTRISETGRLDDLLSPLVSWSLRLLSPPL